MIWVRKTHFKRYHPYGQYKYKNKKQKRIKRKRIYPLGQLFPFQEACVSWMKNIRDSDKHKSVVDVLNTGLGKTVIAFHHIYSYQWNALFLCPNNPIVVQQMINLLKKHFYGVCFSQDLSKISLDITITTYADLAKLEDNHIIFKHVFNTIVYDEIHLLKSRTKQIKQCNKLKGKFYIGLTATLGHEIVPDCFYDAQIYQPNNIDFAKRPSIEHYPLSLNPGQLVAYQQELKSCESLKDARHMLHMRKFLSLLKVNQCVSIFLNNVPNQWKFAIFSDFDETLKNLKLKLPPKSYLSIDTSVPAKKRPSVLKKFEEDNSIRFLLAKRSFAGIGLDLGFVDTLVMIEPAETRFETEQLIGRITRIGQVPKNTANQQIIEFFWKDTGEEKLIQSKVVIDLHAFFANT